MKAEDLDRFARLYYLNEDVPDIIIEERQQAAAMPLVIDALGPTRRVLEMGYGTGLITGELLERGMDMEVVEGSSVLADEAQRRHRTLTVHRCMFEDFEPADPYDGVLALYVLEHVADPVRTLQQIRSWLKPGGTLVAVVPNAESIHRDLAVRMGLQPTLGTLSDRDKLVGHRRVYTLEALTEDLRLAGFRVKSNFGYFLKVVPNSMMLGWDPALLAALSAISPQIPPRLLANIGVRATRA